MPCALLVHLTGRPSANPEEKPWLAKNVVVVRESGWKWTPKEKKHFLPIEWPHHSEAEAVELFQGACVAEIDWEKMFDKDWERAAVRNRGIVSPKPKPNLMQKVHLQRLPPWSVT